MSILDTVEGKAPAAAAAPEHKSHISIDRFEMTRIFEEREEEEKVEAAMNMYAKADRQRMSSSAPEEEEPVDSEEEREARSQQLRLQQKCQDIAALILADELEDSDDED